MRKQFVYTSILSILISTLIFGIGVRYFGGFKNNEVVNVEIESDYAIIAGVIRNTGEGWRLIQDNTHETIGITSVSEDNEKIIIKTNDYSKVSSFNVSVDETMAGEGFTVGASVGTSESWIYIYDKDGSLVKPSDYINSSGNIWINGIFKN